MRLEPIHDTARYILWVNTWVMAFPTLIHEILGTSTLDHSLDHALTLSPTLYSYLVAKAFQNMLNKVTTMDKLKQGCISTDRNLTYGEMEPISIVYVLSFISHFHQRKFGVPFPGKKIVDLGSGRGKALMVASLVHPFRIALGVEIVESLFQEALHLHRHTFESERLFLDQNMEGGTNFIYLNQDLRCMDTTILLDASVILVHATMFDVHLMECVQELCMSSRIGSYFIMVSQCLQNKTSTVSFQTLAKFELSMSWGQTTVFIQQKVFNADENCCMFTNETWLDFRF